MNWFRLLMDKLAWAEHPCFVGTKSLRMAESLWETMRGVGGGGKSEHRSWWGKFCNFMDEDRRVSIETIGVQFEVCVGTVHTIMGRSGGSSERDFVAKGQHYSNPIGGISTMTMQQSTTPSVFPTIWPRWASSWFLTLPTVQTLLPVTFGCSPSSRKTSEAVVLKPLRRWKRLWRGSWTGLHWRTSRGPSRSCWNDATSALQLEGSTLKGTKFSCLSEEKKCPYEKSLKTYWRHLVYIEYAW